MLLIMCPRYGFLKTGQLLWNHWAVQKLVSQIYNIFNFLYFFAGIHIYLWASSLYIYKTGDDFVLNFYKDVKKFLWEVDRTLLDQKSLLSYDFVFSYVLFFFFSHLSFLAVVLNFGGKFKGVTHIYMLAALVEVSGYVAIKAFYGFHFFIAMPLYCLCIGFWVTLFWGCLTIRMLVLEFYIWMLKLLKIWADKYLSERFKQKMLIEDADMFIFDVEVVFERLTWEKETFWLEEVEGGERLDVEVILCCSDLYLLWEEFWTLYMQCYYNSYTFGERIKVEWPSIVLDFWKTTSMLHYIYFNDFFKWRLWEPFVFDLEFYFRGSLWDISLIQAEYAQAEFFFLKIHTKVKQVLRAIVYNLLTFEDISRGKINLTWMINWDFRLFNGWKFRDSVQIKNENDNFSKVFLKNYHFQSGDYCLFLLFIFIRYCVGVFLMDIFNLI